MQDIIYEVVVDFENQQIWKKLLLSIFVYSEYVQTFVKVTLTFCFATFCHAYVLRF